MVIWQKPSSQRLRRTWRRAWHAAFPMLAAPLVGIGLLVAAASWQPAAAQGSTNQPTLTRVVTSGPPIQGSQGLTLVIIGSFTNFDTDAPSGTIPFFGCEGVFPAIDNTLEILGRSSLRVQINIAANAEVGPCDVFVFTGTSEGTEIAVGRGLLNILPLAPAGGSTLPLANIVSVTPSRITQGKENILVTIELTNIPGLQQFAITNLSLGQGISVEGIDTPVAPDNPESFAPTATSSNSITARIDVSATAVAGPRDVSVTLDPDPSRDNDEIQVRGSNLFLVSTPSPPANKDINEIAPNRAFPGNTLNVNILGVSTQFVEGLTAVIFQGGGITVNSFQVINRSVVSANITVDINAEASARTVLVVTNGNEIIPLGGGQNRVNEINETASLTNGFTVLSLTPAPAAPGEEPTVPLPEPEPPSITIKAARGPAFNPTDTMEVQISIRNAGPRTSVDAFLALRTPAGRVFLLNSDLRSFSLLDVANSASFIPVASGLDLTPGFEISEAPLVTNRISDLLGDIVSSSQEIFGVYTLVAALARPNSNPIQFLGNPSTDSFIVLRPADVPRVNVFVDITPKEIPAGGTATITVLVTDQLTGQPVAGETVEFFAEGAEPLDEFPVTARDGLARFSFTDRSAGADPGLRQITVRVRDVVVRDRLTVGFVTLP